MRIVLGLGNPGDDYAHTRHNAGWLALEETARKWEATPFTEEPRRKSLVAKATYEGDTWILAKPLTFMNRSGEAARALVDFYKTDIATEFLVMYDDIDLPLGEIRTTGTSSGGHNGMKSLFEHLGTTQLKRVRIGIDSEERPPQISTADFVLQRFSQKELERLAPALTAAHKSAFEQLYEPTP